MKQEILKKELDFRIKLNGERLQDDYYNIDNVFVGDEASWPGDKEGRALLAFVSHYKINGLKIPCMELMIEKIPEVTNGKMFFGNKTEDILFEQQLSGHSWYLRGLCEYYEQFSDERALDYLHKTVDSIYLPTKGKYSTYPIDRKDTYDGGVGGHSVETINGWKLSSDIGCAFMSIDGLSHYYQITRDTEIKELLDEMSEVFDKIDKYSLQTQTHCTLTAARGFMRMYDITGEEEYFHKAERIFDLYVNAGMTYTYQNFNWFGKGDTWTEPCAIVDSIMLAVMLYEATKKEEYRTYAARIYFNGFATLQRPNGGAGTDTTVSESTDTLRCDLYEAYFCCTMRLAEGLWFVDKYQDILYAQTTDALKKDSFGRYFNGDILYAEISPEFEEFAQNPMYIDGHKLFPLVNLYKLKDEEMCKRINQKVIFKD